MFLKTLVLVSLGTVCLCEDPSHSREKKSNQATYSQSFTRKDVPLSYEYSAVHVYNPKQNQHQAEKISNNLSKPVSNPISYPGIQYAPLPLTRPERQRQNEAGLYTQITSQVTKPKSHEEEEEVTEDTTKYVAKKNNLEPIVISEVHNNYEKPKSNNYHVPGHNIYIHQSPTHNPEPINYQVAFGTAWNKQNVDYPRHFTMYHKQMEASTEPPFQSNVIKYTLTERPNPFLPAYYNSYQLEFQPIQHTKQELDHLPPALHAKGPQLQLNIARGQKIAQTPYQAPALAPFHPKPSYYQNNPSYAKLNAQHPLRLHNLPLQPKNMSSLNPLPNHLHFALYSRT